MLTFFWEVSSSRASLRYCFRLFVQNSFSSWEEWSSDNFDIFTGIVNCWLGQGAVLLGLPGKLPGHYGHRYILHTLLSKYYNNVYSGLVSLLTRQNWKKQLQRYRSKIWFLSWKTDSCLLEQTLSYSNLKGPTLFPELLAGLLTPCWTHPVRQVFLDKPNRNPAMKLSPAPMVSWTRWKTT